MNKSIAQLMSKLTVAKLFVSLLAAEWFSLLHTGALCGVRRFMCWFFLLHLKILYLVKSDALKSFLSLESAAAAGAFRPPLLAQEAN